MTGRLLTTLAFLLCAGLPVFIARRGDDPLAPRGPASTDGRFVVFSATQPGLRLVVPADATPEELRAAQLIQSTLAKSSGHSLGRFPIHRESAPDGLTQFGLFVGQTRRAADFLATPPAPPFDVTVGWRSQRDGLLLKSEDRRAIESAASWFLESTLGAHWFTPGPLGEVIPARPALSVAAASQVTHRPGFVSRDLSGIDGPAGVDWKRRNRLRARIDHSHNLAGIFRPADFRAHPEMAPVLNGQRYIPQERDDNWQPNFLSPAAIEHAATVAGRAFTTDPARITYSLSVNDSLRFDASAATLAAVAPPRFFRGRPDYSDLVFRFANEVAARIAPTHPGKYVSSYAYYWTENTPRFSVAPNVVPVLTADRAQWFDPEFAREDQALIKRWTASGAKLVGVYDYLYGAPYLVPRPTLYAIKASIPFEHRAGVGAFYAEMSPNWALDGPKPWLVAQLTWNPTADPDALVETYYREFWREAAGPVREFFAECERVWQQQPLPSYWIKYFREDHQAVLFPPDVRARLRAAVEAARAQAKTPEVIARVAWLSAGLSVTEAFAEMCETRWQVGRLATSASGESLARAGEDYARAHARFVALHAEVRKTHPTAVAPQDLRFFVQHDPAGRLFAALNRTDATRPLLDRPALQPLFAPSALRPPSSALSLPPSALSLPPSALSPPPSALRPPSSVLPEWTAAFAAPNLLADPTWTRASIGSIDRSIDFAWTPVSSPWQGRGEPAEGRKIVLKPSAQPTTGSSDHPTIRPSDHPAIRPSEVGLQSTLIQFEHCKLESLGQWVPAKPDTLYVAQVKVKARVSPGNGTFVILSFLDAQHRHVGTRRTDRLPPDAAVQEAELTVVGRAPANAAYVGIGLCITNQVNDDFVEFSEPALRGAR